MQKPTFLTHEIYHIYNRGVEKRNIFTSGRDYKRFCLYLEKLNSANPAGKLYRETGEVRPPHPGHSGEVRPPHPHARELPLVEILAFVLMPNHYHLLARQVQENGIVKFMQKLGTGYTMYFNTKNERVGPLFQGSFKAVHIETNEQLMYIPHYIHMNPLDLNRGGSTSPREFMENYAWSSLGDYIAEERKFPFLKKEFILEMFEGADNYKRDLRELLQDRERSALNMFSDIHLDS